MMNMKKAIMIVTDQKTTFIDLESGDTSEDGEVCLVKIKDLRSFPRDYLHYH